MAITDTTVGAFLDGLRSALMARPGLAGVPVFTGEVADKDAGAKSIQFGPVQVTADWYSLGRKQRKETYTIDGYILVVEYGGDESVIKAARDGALSIFGEVNACLVADPTVSGAVLTSEITGFSLAQVITGKNLNARGGGIVFTISVEAHLKQGV